ncbi:MAG: HAD hydrolase-like protein, partial [Pseudomonadota bacterium]
KRVLVVGDGLDTDIRGANNQDYDVVFVAEGIFAEASRGADGRLSPIRLETALSERGVHAQFAMEELSW